MSAGSALVIGVVIGVLISGVSICVVLFHSGSNLFVIDRWWMENSERWEWLRQQEIEHPVLRPRRVRDERKRA